MQARVINENLLHQLEAVNAALTSLRGGFALADPESNRAATSDKLKLLSDARPVVSAMTLLNGDGTVVASSSQTSSDRSATGAGDRKGLDFRALQTMVRQAYSQAAADASATASVSLNA